MQSTAVPQLTVILNPANPIDVKKKCSRKKNKNVKKRKNVTKIIKKTFDAFVPHVPLFPPNFVKIG